MDSLFFVVSKLAWLVISPGSFLLLLLIAGLVCLWLGWRRAAHWLLGLPILIFTLIACLPLDEWLLYPLEARFPTDPPLPAQVRGIIVLGGSMDLPVSAAWDQVELNEAADRNFAFLELARRYPDAVLVFTGGSGMLLAQESREADYAPDFFAALGLEPRRIVFERESRNTWENALYSQEALGPGRNENWILVTSAFHMPRSVGIFCSLGWPVIPWPVDHYTSPGRMLRVEFDFAGNLDLFTTGVREWVGLTAYYLTGRSESFLPGPCPSA